MTANGHKKIWTAILPAMVFPFIASLFYFVLFSEYFFARLLYGSVKIFTLVWPLAALFLILKKTFPTMELAHEKHRKAVFPGIIAGMIIVAVMFLLLKTPLGTMVNNAAPDIRSKATELGFVKHYWTFAIFLSLIHSLMEEYYWRWFVFGHLRDVTKLSTAHLLCGLSFGAHHIVVATQFFPFGWGLFLGSLVGLGSMIWSFMYDRQKTLVGAWVCHSIVDLGIMSIGHKLIFGTYM